MRDTDRPGRSGHTQHAGRKILLTLTVVLLMVASPVGLSLVLEHREIQWQARLQQSRALQLQLLWMQKNHTEFGPLVKHLNADPDNILGVIDRSAAWSSQIDTGAASLSRDQSDELLVEAPLPGVDRMGQAVFQRLGLSIEATLMNENALLQLIGSLDRIAPDQTDLSACELTRELRVSRLRLNCKLTVLADLSSASCGSHDNAC